MLAVLICGERAVVIKVQINILFEKQHVLCIGLDFQLLKKADQLQYHFPSLLPSCPYVKAQYDDWKTLLVLSLYQHTKEKKIPWFFLQFSISNLIQYNQTTVDKVLTVGIFVCA